MSHFAAFIFLRRTNDVDRFDVEYPIECDDEYWEHEDPGRAFQHPPGKPSSITSFVCFIKLCEILGLASRMLYTTTKKSKIQSGSLGHDWEAQTVAELDSSMNKWKDSLPEHRTPNILFILSSTYQLFRRSYLGPTKTGRPPLPTVCKSSRYVLLRTDPSAPTFHDQKISYVLLFSRNVHICCQILC